MSGRRCLRRLYLECYRRDLMAPPNSAQRMLFVFGREMGELARACFPGHTFIGHDFRRHAEAAEATRRALADTSVTSICEAAFEHENVRIRADVLRREESGGWNLIEVKAASRVKDEHRWDTALQLHVLLGTGVPVASVGVMHVDRDYVFEGGEPEVDRLFKIEDVTDWAFEHLPEVGADLEAMWSALGGPEPAPLLDGRRCRRPRECPFLSQCADGTPAHPVWELPGVHEDLLVQLADLGIDCVDEIPEEYPGLTELQERACRAVRTDELCVRPEALAPLREVGFPVHFLDFEAFMPSIPLFRHTRPFQTLPFQFSDHVLHDDGSAAHDEYLHASSDDPRRPLAEKLLDCLGEEGSIVTYASFERVLIKGLADDLPDLRDPLLRVADRVLDLHHITREAVYHPEFHGSFSLKKVVPVLLPGMGYDDLEVADGALAAFLYAKLMAGDLPVSERQAACRALRLYCRRDTEGLLELFRRLRTLAGRE